MHAAGEGGDTTHSEETFIFSSASQQRERCALVQRAIRHAWLGCKSYLLDRHPCHRHFLGFLPFDDLKPVSLSGDSMWVHSAATLYDSLDSLYLAGLKEEYDEAVELALSLPLPLHPLKTFECSIRVLGGLLGACSVSGDARLLGASMRIADALLDGPFRSSRTALPRSYDALAPSWRHASSWKFWEWGGMMLVHRTYAWVYRIGRDWMGEHRANSLAGVGTFALEFAYLSKLTGDPRYKDAMAWSVFQSIEKYCKMDVGYSGLKDVDSLEFLDNRDSNRVNSMPSFLIAETLKYLLLTFAPDSHVSLHDFVFTTEAHPLRQLYTLNPVVQETVNVSAR